MNTETLNAKEQELVALLTKLYEYINDIEKNMSLVGKSAKRARIEPESQIKFRNNITTIKKNWHKVLNKIFIDLSDPKEYEIVAIDLVTRLNKARDNFGLRDDNYRLIWDSIVSPVISMIMEEEEVTRASKARQERRKDFIRNLIDFRLDTVAGNRSRESSAESASQATIDVCAASQTANRMDSGANRCLFHKLCTLESIQILEILVDNIRQHCKVLSNPNVDMTEQIYHIINIAHLIDLLRLKFKEIRMGIDKDIELGLQGFIDPNLCSLLERIEGNVRENLNSFDSCHPLSLLKSDLTSLSIQLRLMKPIMKKFGR